MPEKIVSLQQQAKVRVDSVGHTIPEPAVRAGFRRCCSVTPSGTWTSKELGSC